MAKEFKISDKQDSVEEVKGKSTATILNTEKQAQKKEPKKEKAPKIKKPFNWKGLIFPSVAILTLLGISLFYYFGIFMAKPIPIYDILKFDKMFIISEKNPSIYKEGLSLLSKPEEPRTEVSPLNGLLFSKKEMDEMKRRRPVAVMINNHVEARPLSGLNYADIVIEANAESGITRHLVIFWSKAPEKVGPIRSARQSYLEWASEYDPIYIHDGCAETNDPRTNACGNIHQYGIKSISTIGAWRSNEGGRVAPHNEYSSVKNAWAYAKKMNWDSFPSTIGSWKFKRDDPMEERGSKTTVKVQFHTRLVNGGLYDSTWKYQPSTNSYLREIGGKTDKDTETNTQIQAKVIILQEVKVVPSGDDKGRLITSTTGEGKAVILQDGNITYGKWKKTDRTSRTKYFDSSDKEIEFNRGRIWISMIPHSDGKFDIIEQ